MFYLCRPYMVQRLFDIINIAGYIKILEFFFYQSCHNEAPTATMSCFET